MSSSAPVTKHITLSSVLPYSQQHSNIPAFWGVDTTVCLGTHLGVWVLRHHTSYFAEKCNWYMSTFFLLNVERKHSQFRIKWQIKNYLCSNTMKQNHEKIKHFWSECLTEHKKYRAECTEGMVFSRHINAHQVPLSKLLCQKKRFWHGARLLNGAVDSSTLQHNSNAEAKHSMAFLSNVINKQVFTVFWITRQKHISMALVSCPVYNWQL